MAGVRRMRVSFPRGTAQVPSCLGTAPCSARFHSTDARHPIVISDDGLRVRIPDPAEGCRRRRGNRGSLGGRGAGWGGCPGRCCSRAPRRSAASSPRGSSPGHRIDIGAESVLARRPEALDLADRSGLGPTLVHPAASGAYVWTRGKLRPLPAKTLLGIPGDLTALARSQVLTLPELMRVPLDGVLPRDPLTGDAALGAYVARRLGHGVVDRLLEPLLGGVYAGHADQLSFEAALPEAYGRVAAGGSLLAVASDLVSASSGGAGLRVVGRRARSSARGRGRRVRCRDPYGYSGGRAVPTCHWLAPEPRYV